MLKNVARKVAWVGRTASMVFGLALVMALVFGIAATAMGATGGNFILGKANGASAVSKLTASVAGPALTLVNQSTQAPATALNISVASGKTPLRVNAAAGTAAGLSADELDGKDSGDFFPARGNLPDGTTLRGNFEIDGDADQDTGTSDSHSVASNAISFGFALASAPQAHTIDVNEAPPAECPGTASSPEAAPGHLCVYESYEENERDPGWNSYPNTLNTTPYGTGLYTQSQDAGGFFVSRGTWAVTAP